MKHTIPLFSILLLCACTSVPKIEPGNFTLRWAGTWTGTLANLPEHPGAKPVEVKMGIGEFPTEDNSSSLWRTTYSEQGEIRQVKDYRLCRGTGADDLSIDEGDGIKLKSRLIDDVLVTPFQYNDVILITSVRLRGDVIEQEILTVADKPALDGVQPLTARSIQRIVMSRQTSQAD